MTPKAQQQAELVRLKILRLLEMKSVLEEEVLMLKAENVELKRVLANQTKSIENLEERNKISKLADGIHFAKQDVTSVKLEINRYIREIDECLKLLNNLPDNN